MLSKIVDDVEALGPLGIIDAANIDQHLEEAFRIVAQEGEQPRHRIALHRDHQLVMRDRGPGHVLRESGRNVIA